MDTPQDSSSAIRLRLLPIGSAQTRRVHAIASFHGQIVLARRETVAATAALDRDDATGAIAGVGRLLATILAAEHIASALAEVSPDDLRSARSLLHRTLAAVAPVIIRARSLQPDAVNELLRRFG
jgi:hypothetical protein